MWVFGYGSIMWRPGFTFQERTPAFLAGWTRRFYQASTDHRGVPGAPGRVVTLLRDAREGCWGVAYRVDEAEHRRTFADLDHREKNGYERHRVRLSIPERGELENVLIYVAGVSNDDYLGPASAEEIAAQAEHAVGPSGTNREYVFELARALRDMGREDPHVFDIERALRARIAREA